MPDSTCGESAGLILLTQDGKHAAFACRQHYDLMLSRMTTASGSMAQAFACADGPGPYCEIYSQMADVN